MKALLHLFRRPAQDAAVEQMLREDYELLEAHRRCANQVTTLQLVKQRDKVR